MFFLCENKKKNSLFLNLPKGMEPGLGEQRTAYSSTHFQIGTAHSFSEDVSRAADKQYLRARQVLGREKAPFSL